MIFILVRKKRLSMLDLLIASSNNELIDNAGIQEEVDTFIFEVNLLLLSKQFIAKYSTFIYCKIVYCVCQGRKIDTSYRYNRISNTNSA